ncbi:Unspecified monosaccharide ABC transport system, ATP-binding protein [Bacillus amyloliquefaciens]|nr:Unspecified monosaccharide ABC transport system, ATP-binding protein [Bacillus amyloliquefaciens]
MDYIIEMLNIRKEFPGIVANDDVTLQVKKWRNTRPSR